MPRSRSALGALVDHEPPVGRLAYFEPQLEARTRALLRLEARAARLAGERGGHRLAVSPLVIVTGMPAAVAISAATTFERIPPDPSGELDNPMS